MTPPSYPGDLEQWWLRECARALRLSDPESCLDALLPEVQKLSDLFTIEREPGFGGYASDPRAQLAYGLFFFPQSFVRARLALAECLNSGPPVFPGRAARLLDLGAGLGAASLAAAHFLGGAREAALTALDQSASGLDILRRIADDLQPLWPRVRLDTRQGDLRALPAPAEGKWDCIMACFALNEILADEGDDETLFQWIQTALNHLEPSGLLLMLEPATKIAATRLQRARDRLAAAGQAALVAPCLHHRACPLLRNEHAWCHEVRLWNAPAAMAYLNRRLFRSIDTLKFSFLALRPGRPAPDEGLRAYARLVAPLCEMKGKIVTSGCASDGNLYKYERLTRGLSREEKDRLLALERGDRIRFAEPALLGDGRTLRALDAQPGFSNDWKNPARFFQ